jgi:hypothetical protein
VIVSIGVAAAVIVAGTSALLLGGRSAPNAAVTMGRAVGTTLECPGGTVYFEVGFQVLAVSAPLTTANFGVSVLDHHGDPIASNGAAPAPSPALPCSSPPPDVWYALLQPLSGSVDTFPSAAGGWSGAVTGGTPVTVGCVLEILTPGDATGTDDSLAAFGMNGANVTFLGNLTFPPYEHP